MGVFVNCGSRDEKENEQGLAHFIEHAIFKGTAKRKSFHILSRLEDVGGDLNAYTTKEETAIHASFLVEYYERTFDLISDILFNSTFPEKEIEKEKDVVIDEINSTLDTPPEIIYDDFEELLFRPHALGRSILGTPESVAQIKREDILQFMANNYHTDQMVISSVGEISFEKLVALAEHYFGSAPARLRQFKRQPVEVSQSVEQRIKKDYNQAHCILGGSAYDLYHPKKLDLVLFNNIVGGPGMNSRLNLSLRERHGLTYNVESNYSPYLDTGVWCVYFSSDYEDLDLATELVYKELKHISEVALGDIQLRKAKKQLIGQLAISSENNENLMLSIGKSYLSYEYVESLPEIYQKIEKITASDILEVANNVLNSKKLSTLIYY
jgi:predicted Zn-dependent peptidase